MLALILLLLSLFRDGSLAKTTSQAHQCTGHVVKTSDQTPTVPYHEVVNMSVWFTSVYPPKPVIWCCNTTGNCTDMTDHLIIHGNSYETKLTIWSVEDYNWGRYTLSVCHHIIQNFTIYPIDDCGDDLPNATKISSNYAGPVGLNHFIDCYFHGDTDSFDYIIKWIFNGKEVNDNRHIQDRVKSESCSFQERLTILNVTTADSGIYECYALDQGGLANGTRLDVTIKFLEYPEVFTTPNNQTLCRKNRLQLKWHVTGNAESNNIYIKPVISINTIKLESNWTYYTLKFIEDTILQNSRSYLVLSIDKVLDLQTNGEKTLKIQVYLKFQPNVSNVDDYNNNPNHSGITIITIKDIKCILLLIEKIVIGPIVLGAIFFICVCCCYYKRRGRRDGYILVPDDDDDHLHNEVADNDEEDHNEEEETDSDNEGRINQGSQRVSSRSETGNESDIYHDNSHLSALIATPEQASQHTSQPEEDQPGGDALVASRLLSVPRYSHSRYDSQSMHSEATPYGSLHNRESSARQTHSEERSLPPLSSPRTREQYTLDPAPNTNHLKPPNIINDDDDNEKDGSASQRKLSFPTIKEVFILYCKNTFDQVWYFLQMLNHFSYKDVDSGEQHYSCTVDFSYERHATVTNWSNWTERKIKDATHVLIVCTPELYDHLSQTDSTVFETHRGPVSSNMVANLMTDQKHSSKFIPVFLNTPVNRSHVPAALLGKRCYELRINQLIKNTMNDDDTQIYDGAVTMYLSHHDEMKDLTDLITILRSH